jgi:hypothetical protein
MSRPSEDRDEMDWVEKLAAEFERAAASNRRMPPRARPLALLAHHRRVAMVIALVVLACVAATVIAMNATASGPPSPKSDVTRAMPVWVREATVPMATDRLGHQPAVIEWMKTEARTAMRMLGGRNVADAPDAAQSTYVVLITDKELAAAAHGGLGGANDMTAMFFILSADAHELGGYGYISGQSFRLAFGPMYLDPASRDRPSQR